MELPAGPFVRPTSAVDLVMEQFDSLGPNIAESMLRGYYREHCRGTFVGIKTQKIQENPVSG